MFRVVDGLSFFLCIVDGICGFVQFLQMGFVYRFQRDLGFCVDELKLGFLWAFYSFSFLNLGLDSHG